MHFQVISVCFHVKISREAHKGYVLEKCPHKLKECDTLRAREGENACSSTII